MQLEGDNFTSDARVQISTQSGDSLEVRSIMAKTWKIVAKTVPIPHTMAGQTLFAVVTVGDTSSGDPVAIGRVAGKPIQGQTQRTPASSPASSPAPAPTPAPTPAPAPAPSPRRRLSSVEKSQATFGGSFRTRRRSGSGSMNIMDLDNNGMSWVGGQPRVAPHSLATCRPPPPAPKVHEDKDHKVPQGTRVLPIEGSNFCARCVVHVEGVRQGSIEQEFESAWKIMATVPALEEEFVGKAVMARVECPSAGSSGKAVQIASVFARARRRSSGASSASGRAAAAAVSSSARRRKATPAPSPAPAPAPAPAPSPAPSPSPAPAPARRTTKAVPVKATPTTSKPALVTRNSSRRFRAHRKRACHCLVVVHSALTPPLT